MEPKTTEDIVAHVREWAIDKIEDAELCGDKIALYAEFGDWIDLDEVEELENCITRRRPRRRRGVDKGW